LSYHRFRQPQNVRFGGEDCHARPDRFQEACPAARRVLPCPASGACRGALPGRAGVARDPGRAAGARTAGPTTDEAANRG